MATRELYVDRIEAQIKKLEGMFDDLRRRAQLGSKEALADLNRISKELKPHERSLRQEIVRAKGVSNAAWRDLKLGMERAWRDLRGAYDAAKESYRASIPGPKPVGRRTTSTRRARTSSIHRP